MVVDGLARLARWRLPRDMELHAPGAPTASPRRLVLRRDPPGAPLSGLRLEGALLRAAAPGRGARAPGSSWWATTTPPLGAGSIVMEFVEGETIPRRILRDERSGRGPARCWPPSAAGSWPPSTASRRTRSPGWPAATPRAAPGRRRPARASPIPPSSWASGGWATTGRRARPRRVVHGDFRNGNLIVGPDGIRAVLDWELAHLGDPLEDLGWLCVKAWRFGSPLPVGGFGTVEQLVTAYEEAGGAAVDRAALHWWQVLGTLRWGIICIVQALTHLSGTVRSVELAAIGRRVCEVEWDLLELLGLPVADRRPPLSCRPGDRSPRAEPGAVAPRRPVGRRAARGRARVPRVRRDGRHRGPGALPRPGGRQRGGHGGPRDSCSGPGQDDDHGRRLDGSA